MCRAYRLVAVISISTRWRAASLAATGCKRGWMKRKMSCKVLRRVQGESTRSTGNVFCSPFDSYRDLLGVLLWKSVDRISGTSAARSQRAHQHAPGIEPRLVEVLVVHVVQRLGEDLGLREVVARIPGPRRGGQRDIGGQPYVIATELNGEKTGERLRPPERQGSCVHVA